MLYDMANNVHIVRLLLVFSFLSISNIYSPLHAQFVVPKFDEIKSIVIPKCINTMDTT
jgi:hypothetical protein